MAIFMPGFFHSMGEMSERSALDVSGECLALRRNLMARCISFVSCPQASGDAEESQRERYEDEEENDAQRAGGS